MGFLSKIKENRFETSGLANPKQWLIDLIGGSQSISGVKVTEENAMTFSAVYAAVRIIAETIASLPLNVYREMPDGGKEKAKSNYLYPLLHNKPNSLMTSFTWREMLLAHLLHWGNHYSQIELDNSGRVIGLWPLLPNQVEVKLKNKKLYYVYSNESGKQTVYASNEILHIPGLGFNGYVGFSVIRMAREAIALGLAAEQFGSRFFGQGAQPGGIIEYPGQMTEEAYQRYKSDVNKKYGGLGNSHKIMVLEEGLKYHQTGIPPNDAQFLETRKFQIQEIARIFRVPPHMLADLERATFSNIEQQSIDFIIYTIRPWLVRIEQALNDKLISSKNNTNYIKFVVEGMLRGDAESRSSFYNSMFNLGAMSPNDIREKEEMNPVPGGDQRFVPLNMIPLEEAQLIIDQDPDGSEDNDAKYIRAKRSAGRRINIRKRYHRLIKNKAEEIVQREVNKIRDLVNKELKSEKRNEINFRDALVKFYDDKFPAEIKKTMTAVIRDLADAVAREAAKEAGLKDYNIDNFFNEYITAMSQRYAGYSRGQLLALINEAGDLDEAVEYVEQRLVEWEEKKSESIALEQSVKAEGAFTRSVYAAAGVVELVWIANANCCEICQELDGKVVGIEQVFIEEGDQISDFKAGGAKLHPPLHDKCECSIGLA